MIIVFLELITHQQDLYYHPYIDIENTDKVIQIEFNDNICLCNKILNQCEINCCCDPDCRTQNDVSQFCVQEKKSVDTYIQLCNANLYENEIKMEQVSNFFEDNLSRISIFCLEKLNLQAQKVQKKSPLYLNQNSYQKLFLDYDSKYYQNYNYFMNFQQRTNYVNIILINIVAVIINF